MNKHIAHNYEDVFTLQELRDIVADTKDWPGNSSIDDMGYDYINLITAADEE